MFNLKLIVDKEREIESFKEYIYNDGVPAREGNIKVEWFDNYVQVTLMGGEQDDDVHKIYYNGISWIKEMVL